MNNQEYENKKRECWKVYFKHVVCGTDSPEYWFNKIFDRAYALGKHNLTSDAEGEEMLTVSRKQVQEYYRDYTSAKDSCGDNDADIKYSFIGRCSMLSDLFGSKCLLDDTKDGTKNDTKEPKPAEPTDKNPKENANTFALSQGTEPTRLENDHLQVRLQVSAMMAQGLLTSGEDYTGDCKFVVKKSLEIADALIAEVGTCKDRGKS